jgi:hypothetical protein
LTRFIHSEINFENVRLVFLEVVLWLYTVCTEMDISPSVEDSGGDIIETMLGIHGAQLAMSGEESGNGALSLSDSTDGPQQQLIMSTVAGGGPPSRHPSDTDGLQPHLLPNQLSVVVPAESDGSQVQEMLVVNADGNQEPQFFLRDNKGGLLALTVQNAIPVIPTWKTVTVEYDASPKILGIVREVKFQSGGNTGDKAAIIADLRRQLLEDNSDFGNDQLHDVMLFTDTIVKMRGENVARRKCIDNQYVVQHEEYLTATFPEKKEMVMNRYENGIVMLINAMVTLQIYLNTFLSMCICDIERSDVSSMVHLSGWNGDIFNNLHSSAFRPLVQLRRSDSRMSDEKSDAELDSGVQLMSPGSGRSNDSFGSSGHTSPQTVSVSTHQSSINISYKLWLLRNILTKIHTVLRDLHFHINYPLE